MVLIKNTILMLLFLFFVSCTGFKKEERKLQKGKNDAVLVIETPKAGCENCQRIIEEGLNKTSGVKQSILNLNLKTVSILYNPMETNPKIIKNEVALLSTQIPCK
jgi:mercuric ion binding protein